MEFYLDEESKYENSKKESEQYSSNNEVKNTYYTRKIYKSLTIDNSIIIITLNL